MRIELLTTEPTSEPIQTSDIKSQANITTSDDDSYIASSLIPAARKYCEDYIGRALYDQSWTLYLDHWQTEIMLGRHPVLDVTSIKYIDTNNNQQTLASSKYRVDTKWGRITEAYNETWPSVNDVTNAIEIEYRAGYVDTAASPNTGLVPGPILLAIKMLCAHWYGPGREPTTGERDLHDVPFTVTALLDRYRVYTV